MPVSFPVQIELVVVEFCMTGVGIVRKEDEAVLIGTLVALTASLL